MSRLSMDLKVLPRSHRGHKNILCIIDEVTSYLIMVPIFQAKSEEIGEALIENVITKYCIPEYIIMDQDSAFMPSVMMYLFHKFDIKIKTVAPYNNQSLQAEHGIKSLFLHPDQASHQLGTNVAKISITGNICIQYIQYPKFRQLQPI